MNTEVLKTKIFIPDTLPLRTKDQIDLDSRIQRINTGLSGGKTALDLVDEFHLIPNPILIDFNRVIADEFEPLCMNPEAPEALHTLSRVGTVCIVTLARSREKVVDFFRTNRLLNPHLIVLTYSSFRDFVQPHTVRDSLKKDKIRSLRTSHLAKVREMQSQFQYATEDVFIKDSHFKRVAPLFGKSHLVPLIDDSLEATENNPGILGFPVVPWYSPEEQRHDSGGFTSIPMIRGKRTSLGEAVDAVKKLSEYKEIENGVSWPNIRFISTK